MGLGVKSALKGVMKSMRKRELLPIDNVVPASRALEGKIALVAGGSGGIGMAIAETLLEAGAKVVLGGTNRVKLDACVERLGHAGRVSSVVLNVADTDDIVGSVSEAMAAFGGLDILVVSSGVHTEGVDFWTMTPEEFDRVMSVNLRGAYFLCRSVARGMADNGTKGHILLVNSCRGYEPAWSPYGISKWGLRGLTQGLAQALLPHGIVVNGLAPGTTATPLIGVSEGESIASEDNGVGRLATPREIAAWARMLVGPEGDMVVGETVLVSGGRGCIDVR